MIRDAVALDIPHLVEMGREFHGISPYRSVPFEAESFAASLGRYIESPDWTVKVLEDGTINGVAIAVIQRFYFNEGLLTAQELMWWVDPKKRGGGLRLLNALEEWARGMGAATLAMGDVPGVRCLETMYRRRGYMPADNIYIRSL